MKQRFLFSGNPSLGETAILGRYPMFKLTPKGRRRRARSVARSKHQWPKSLAGYNRFTAQDINKSHAFCPYRT